LKSYYVRKHADKKLHRHALKI